MFQGALLLGRSIGWHYTRGVAEVVSFWRQLVLVAWHFFSIPLLVRTFFSPLSYEPHALEHANGFIAFCTRSILRVVGVLVRSVLLAVGLLVSLSVVIAGAGALFFWLSAHFILAFLLFGFLVILLSSYAGGV